MIAEYPLDTRPAAECEGGSPVDKIWDDDAAVSRLMMIIDIKKRGTGDHHKNIRRGATNDPRDDDDDRAQREMREWFLSRTAKTGRQEIAVDGAARPSSESGVEREKKMRSDLL